MISAAVPWKDPFWPHPARCHCSLVRFTSLPRLLPLYSIEMLAMLKFFHSSGSGDVCRQQPAPRPFTSTIIRGAHLLTIHSRLGSGTGHVSTRIRPTVTCKVVSRTLTLTSLFIFLVSCHSSLPSIPHRSLLITTTDNPRPHLLILWALSGPPSPHL